jgi:polysaccharide pyruvyl transferase WcaK-like protein
MNESEESGNKFPVASGNRRGPRPGGSRRNVVTISNVFADHNKGGAAITAETVQMVRRALPDARIRLVAVRNETSGFERSHRFTLDRFPDVSISGPLVATGHGPFAGLRAAARSVCLVCLAPRLASSPAIRSIRESDAVVSKGGHVFVERGGLRRSISLWMTSLPHLLAARLQVPTAVLCTTVGPFSTWHSRAVAGFVLRRISRVVVRDDRSYGEAVALGVDPDRVTSLPDIVFSARRPTPERSREVAVRLGFENDRFCAVTVSEGPHDQQFFKNLKSTLTLLLERGVFDRVG